MNCLKCQVEISKGKFCSKSCSTSFHNALKPKRQSKSPIKCLQCNQPTTNPKFCSSSCAASYNNVVSPKRTKSTKKYSSAKRVRTYLVTDRKCLHCDIELNTSQNKYCGYDCQQKYQRERRLHTTGFENLSRETRKKILLTKYGNKCSICNITDWQNKPLVMIMDHIDGDSNNNQESNLRLVCSNCDSQLPTYKSKNKGKGRHYRRERYKQGQSY